MSPRILADLAKLAFPFWNRLTLLGKAVVIAALLALFFTWQHFRHAGDSHARVSVPTSQASGECADKLPFGAPKALNTPATELGVLRFICREGYALGHSGMTKTPLWVAEHLTQAAIGGKEPRTNDFQEDPLLPENERATIADYKHSGYDRGHQAPAADFSRSPKMMSDSFYLSNMVPQSPENNRGPWAHLEGHVRQLTRQSADLYVITGPVFPGARFQTIRGKTVGIPEQLYKVAFDAKAGRMGAWLLPNGEVPPDGWNKYCTSVAAVEKASGLQFYPDVPAAQRAELIAMSCTF